MNPFRKTKNSYFHFFRNTFYKKIVDFINFVIFSQYIIHAIGNKLVLSN